MSALALFAFQYLPLGVFLFKGKLACPQATQEELAQAWVGDVVEQNQDRLKLGQTEILGKGSGTGGALDILMRRVEDVSHVPGADALLWLFSNSGTGADCQTEPIPESTLKFIFEATKTFGTEIRRLVTGDPKDSRLQLFECIRGERDYLGLYPYKTHKGASAELYELYQREIRRGTEGGLSAARKLSAIIRSNEPEKRLKEIRKPEFLKSPTGRSLIRKYIISHLAPAEYDSLFPSERHPIRVKPAGWDYLRYFLATQIEDKRPIATEETDMKTTHPKIIQIAETYRSVEPRKIKNILDRMTQRKIGVRWLQDKFCQTAQAHKDWNLGEWDELVCDEEGKVITFELLFQIRLYLSNLYREVTASEKGEAA